MENRFVCCKGERKMLYQSFLLPENQETRPTLKGSTHCIGFGWYLPIVEKRSDERKGICCFLFFKKASRINAGLKYVSENIKIFGSTQKMGDCQDVRRTVDNENCAKQSKDIY